MLKSYILQANERINLYEIFNKRLSYYLNTPSAGFFAYNPLSKADVSGTDYKPLDNYIYMSDFDKMVKTPLFKSLTQLINNKISPNKFLEVFDKEVATAPLWVVAMIALLSPEVPVEVFNEISKNKIVFETMGFLKDSSKKSLMEPVIPVISIAQFAGFSLQQSKYAEKLLKSKYVEQPKGAKSDILKEKGRPTLHGKFECLINNLDNSLSNFELTSLFYYCSFDDKLGNAILDKIDIKKITSPLFLEKLLMSSISNNNLVYKDKMPETSFRIMNETELDIPISFIAKVCTWDENKSTQLLDYLLNVKNIPEEKIEEIIPLFLWSKLSKNTVKDCKLLTKKIGKEKLMLFLEPLHTEFFSTEINVETHYPDEQLENMLQSDEKTNFSVSGTTDSSSFNLELAIYFMKSVGAKIIPFYIATQSDKIESAEKVRYCGNSIFEIARKPFFYKRETKTEEFLDLLCKDWLSKDILYSEKTTEEEKNILLSNPLVFENIIKNGASIGETFEQRKTILDKCLDMSTYQSGNEYSVNNKNNENKVHSCVLNLPVILDKMSADDIEKISYYHLYENIINKWGATAPNVIEKATLLKNIYHKYKSENILIKPIGVSEDFRKRCQIDDIENIMKLTYRVQTIDELLSHGRDDDSLYAKAKDILSPLISFVEELITDYIENSLDNINSVTEVVQKIKKETEYVRDGNTKKLLNFMNSAYMSRLEDIKNEVNYSQMVSKARLDESFSI